MLPVTQPAYQLLSKKCSILKKLSPSVVAPAIPLIIESPLFQSGLNQIEREPFAVRIAETTSTKSSTPSKLNPWPSLPEVKVGSPNNVPLFPKPEESEALPSNFQWATRPMVGAAARAFGVIINTDKTSAKRSARMISLLFLRIPIYYSRPERIKIWIIKMV